MEKEVKKKNKKMELNKVKQSIKEKNKRGNMAMAGLWMEGYGVDQVGGGGLKDKK